MLEIPEAYVLAAQLNSSVRGKKIQGVTVLASPHKFAWFSGDPQEYPARLTGKTLEEAGAAGGWVFLSAGDSRLYFSDGVSLRFWQRSDRPSKHQLLLEFADGTALSASIQMYGGLNYSENGELDNPYYRAAVEKPSPLTPGFDPLLLMGLISSPENTNLSLKALLATEQRVPGLGNGVLQDILFLAGLHPKRKAGSLSASEQQRLADSVISTLKDMASRGGRDTENDLHGQPGGYRTLMSKNTAGKPCTNCGSPVRKEAYMGGSVYFCPGCQKL